MFLMKIGDFINTSLGKVIVLDIKDKYLILFNQEEGKFIKANNYDIKDNKVFWQQGEYYSNLDGLK